jgi:predicted MFS family arabinose efflux permease
MLLIILFILIAIMAFGIQLDLCNYASGKAVKRIPVFINIALYVLALILCLAYWLNVRDKDAGLVVIAFILSFVNTVTLVANIAAWVVYKQMQKKKQ